MKNFLQICLILSIAALSFSSVAYSQGEENETTSPLSVNGDIVSRYIWRGLNSGGPSPHIQPALEFSKGAFTLGAWGSYSISGVHQLQEIDVYAALNLAGDMITLQVTDYYFPYEGDEASPGFFEYDEEKTGHVIEPAVSFNGTESFPISFLMAMNIYGADAHDAEGDIVYSTYMEVGYSKSTKHYDFNAFCGFVLTEPEENEVGYYGQENPGVINLGLTVSKNIQITEKFSLPVSCSFITNPEADKAYLTFAVSL